MESGRDSGLKLDEETHIYTLDGEVKPGTNEILQATGMIRGTHRYTEQSRQEGNAIHLACAYIDRGQILKPESIDPRIQPAVDTYVEWKNKTRFKASLVEEPIYSEIHGFAGTPDAFGLCDESYTLVDRKRGPLGPAAILAIAGYRQLISEHFNIPIFKIRAFGLTNMGAGKIKMIEVTDRLAVGIFLGLVAAYHWAVNHKLIKETVNGEDR